jgi:hypothetical protein
MPAGPTYEPIATTTITSNTTGITFSSISSSYTDLILVLSIITQTEDASINLRFNSDTGTNYSYTSLYGYSSSAASGRTNSSAQIRILGEYYGTSTTIPTLAKVHIFNYAGSTNKTVLSEASGDKNGTGEVGRFSGLWRNTAAITSITINNNVSSGTTMTLYGIKAA